MAVANVALTNTFDEWRTRTNQIAVQSNSFESYIVDLYNRSNNSPSYTYANNIGVQANTFANALVASANVSVGNGANAYARVIGASSNAHTNTTNSYILSVISGANTAVGTGANAYALAAATAAGIGANNLMISVQNGSNIAVGTGANTFAAVVVGGFANTNAANATYLSVGTVPSARLTGSYTGVTGVGTITTGVWNATDVSLADGGTNASLTASAGAVTYSGASALALTSVGTSGQLLQSGGTSAPSWISPSSLTVATAGNSNALGGYSLQFGSTNGVAGRDGAGDITARLFRAEYPFESSISGGIAFRNASGAGADNYTRFCSNPAAVRDWIGSGHVLIGYIATNTGATSYGFNADFSTYKRLAISAINVSHNGAGTNAYYFNVYSPQNGVSTRCSASYTGSSSWLGYVDIDLYSGIGTYCDDGTTVAAQNFAIYTYTTGIYFNTLSSRAFDGGAIYVWGVR